MISRDESDGLEICSLSVSGTFCSSIRLLVALCPSKTLIFCDFDSGETWHPPPPAPKNINAVYCIHRGSSLIVGGVDGATIIDIPHSMVTQHLQPGEVQIMPAIIHGTNT